MIGFDWRHKLSFYINWYFISIWLFLLSYSLKVCSYLDHNGKTNLTSSAEPFSSPVIHFHKVQLKTKKQTKPFSLKFLGSPSLLSTMVDTSLLVPHCNIHRLIPFSYGSCPPSSCFISFSFCLSHTPRW